MRPVKHATRVRRARAKYELARNINQAGVTLAADPPRKKRNDPSAHLVSKSHFYDPRVALGRAIADAMDPRYAPAPVKTLADMTPEQRAEMERLYGRGPK